MEYTKKGIPMTKKYLADAVKQFENLKPEQTRPLTPEENLRMDSIVASARRQWYPEETEFDQPINARAKVPA